MAYQPKIDCKSGAIVGLEALVRWQHSDKGMVMPDNFIPIAEETGLIDALTTQVLEQSLEWFSGAFPRSNLHLSLNLSARSLVDIQLADHLATLCHLFEIAPERIVLELTESCAMVEAFVVPGICAHWHFSDTLCWHRPCSAHSGREDPA